MRAYTHRFITFAIQAVVILLLVFGLSISFGHSLAQDVATDTPAPSDTATDVPTELATVVPTDVPTEVPTAAPTDLPTEQPTSVPTEAVTEQPSAAPTDATVTVVPTESVTQPPATPVSPDLFQEDFQDAETSGWLLTPGWVVADEAGNKVLAANAPSEMAVLSGVAWPYFTLSVRVRGDLQLNMASSGSSYQIKVAADGAAALYKDGALLGQAAGLPPTDVTVEPAANWHTVNLLAPGNLLAVKVDNFTPISTSDPTLVGMGPIMFSSAADNTASVAFDDVSVHRLDAPPPVPTAVPNSDIVPIPPPTNVTAEPTVEVTAEATVEATTEATAEVTVEATTEATSEATAEATLEPVGLSEAALKKLPPELVEILQNYEAGDTEGAKAAAADYFITTDQQQRINVTLWTTDEQAAATVAGDITAANGVLSDALSIRLQALVTLEGLITLANAPEVTLIEVPPRAVSTGNMEAGAPTGQGTGTEISEGVDTTGAAAWHNAALPVKGAGVTIAVMDTGFGPSVVAASGEYACLGNTAVLNQARVAGDTTHGLSMVQVLCDMAPAAKVKMYKATETASLQSAISTATSDTTIKIIVIAMDVGASVSPGDGTGGGALFADGLYTAITTARNAGKIVIASAGNNTGRYVTLNYTSGTTTVPMQVFPGDTIHVSWNDWATTTNGSNFGLSLGGNFIQPISSGGAVRANNTAPRYSYTVSSVNCPTGTFPNGCAETLTIDNFFGTGPVVIQVQITGNGTLDDTGVSGATVATSAGNIARPADSQDVIAVGSVCPDGTAFSLFLDSFSSHGPVFTAGGGVPGTSSSYSRDQVKPDLSGPTHVSIAGNRTAGQDECENSTGFNGTSAAAAHIAGMAALLVSNTNGSMAAFDGTTSAAVTAVQDYLQTHAVDNITLAANIVGYDMSYGAGYSVLGNPTYDMSQITAISTAANQLPGSCFSAVYAGLNNPGAVQDGSLAAPYISINEAISKATVSQCVVVLPGEYVSPINGFSTTVAPVVMSYESATSFSTAPTNLWSVILSPIFIDSNDIVVDGFAAQSAFTFTYANDSGGTSIRTPALRIRTSSGTVIQNSTFSGYKSPGVIVDSTSIQVKNSTFSGFVIPVDPAAAFTKPASFSATLDITRSTGVVLTNNTFQSNSILGINGSEITPWQPAIIGIRYGGVDLFNNRFSQNTSSTIVGVNQWFGTTGSSLLQVAEIRIFDNLFNANTVNGPLLHLFTAPNMRFINNTVVNNLMNADPNNSGYDAYFAYGNNNSIYPHLSSRKVEIHNNLFYGNGATPDGLLLNVNSTVNVGCDSIEGSDTVPVRNNWFDPVISPTFPGAECGGVNATTSAPNIGGSITDPISVATFFGSSADPVNPFRVRPNTSITLKGGINTGDNTALTDMFGPDLSAVTDLMGATRVILGRNDNPAYSAVDAVDIGAYELGVATPPVAANITQSITEDSATSVIFKLAATGGYSQTFTITAPPTNYDTKTTNACGGLPLAFSPPNTVTYCPPTNFHTFYGPGGVNVPVTIDFSVVDSVGNPGLPSYATITLTINPQDDGLPTPVAFSKITDYGSPLNYQLGPAPIFYNFNLVGAANGVDYPVTFSYVSHDTSGPEIQNPILLGSGGQTDQVLTTAFTQANSTNGLLTVLPVGNQKGLYKFIYRITDRDGDNATGTGSIIVVPAVAQDGHYDDDSFFITYTGTGWAPYYSVSAAYNHTLHASKIAGNQLEFPFTGTIASLNMIGTSLPNSTTKLKVEFNLDISSDSSPYLTYAQAQLALPGLSCVNTLNNLAPDASSNILNYSATSATYKLICRGFPVGAVQSIRLTNNLANAAMTIDAMDVGSGIFKPGFYQESDINFTYIGTGWIKQAIAAASGGTRIYATGVSNSYTFKIANAARFVLFTSPGPTGGTMQVCITPLPSVVPTCSNRTDNHAGTTLYQQQQAFSGLDSAITYKVDVTNVSTLTTQYIDLDALQVFAPTQPLTPALYQQDNVNITYNGSSWIKQAVAQANGGSRTYTSGASNSYSFQVKNAARFTLYTSTNPTGGTMQVCITPLPFGASQICNNRSNYSSVALWQQKQIFNGLNTSTLYNVTVTNVSTVATQNIDLDAIEVSAAPSPLGLGLTQQENANITYYGAGWKLATTTLVSGGNSRYTYGIGDNYVFKVTNAGRFVLYTSSSTTGGTMQVCIAPIPIGASQSCSTRTSKNSVAVYQQQQVFTGLDTGTLYTVTVTNISPPLPTPAQFIDLDAIEVLPDVVPLLPSATLYQQNNTNIIYSGFGWKTLASTLASGGNYRSSLVVGNSYTFRIANADRFVLYISPGPTGGTMNVCYTELVGGVLTGSAICSSTVNNNYAAAAQWQQPRYYTGLDSAKIYSVTVTNASSVANKYIDLDAIEVNAPQVPLVPSPSLYQQNDANIRYTGAGWKTVASTLASGGNYRSTLGMGNSYNFQVTNAARFALYMVPGPTGGTMSVCYNEYPVALPLPTCVNFSDYSAVALWQQPQVISGLDTAKTYSVTVTNTSPVATKYIDLDAIEVFSTLAPVALLEPGFYQQTSPNITFTGAGWKTGASTLASGGNYRYTLGINSDHFSFSFQHSDRFVLFGSTGPTGGTMNVCYTPRGGSQVCSGNTSTYSATALWQQPRYFAGLDSNEIYDVIVTNTSTVATKYIDLDAIEVSAPLVPLVPALSLYQQSDPKIRYTGAGWKTVASTLASGGNYRSSLVIGNSYSFQVMNAERFVLYTSPGPTGGTMQVCIAPTPAGGVACPDASNNRSNYATAALWQQPRFFGGLNTGTTYTVTVTNTSSVANKYIDLDAIEVLAPAVALVPSLSLYQETDPNIAYSGTGWMRGVSTLASGGNFRSTLGINNSYSFQVSGADRFTLFMSTNSTGGIMQVCITPTPVGRTDCPDASNNINLYTAAALWQQPRYFGGLDSGTTYTVIVTNVSSVATKFIALDAIEVSAPLVPLVPALSLYQQSDPKIRYTGAAWKTVASTLASGGNYRSSLVNGNSYTFQVQNAERFVLYTSPGPTGGTMQVCITPTPAGGVACPDASNNRSNYATAALWQQPRFFGGLNTGTTYTVTVTNTSSVANKYIDLDAIEVLAPAVALVPSLSLYQETDPNIAYSGTGWMRGVSTLASGGNFRSTLGINNSYSFQVSGADRFTLFMSTNSTGGIMQVCITPTPVGRTDCPDASNNINLYTAAALWQQPRYFGGLDSGTTYTVIVTNVSSVATKFIALDAIEVSAPLVPLVPSPTLYQQSDPKNRYTGAGWKTGASTLASGGNIRSSLVKDNSYTFQISGATRFSLLTSPSPTGGTMKVCITELPSTPLPCINRSDNAATARWQQAQIFPGLVNTSTYEVTVSNISTLATQYIDLDAIQIVDAAATLLPGWYQDTDLNLTYSSGTWIQDPQAGVSAGQTTVTKTNGNDLQFTFQGTGFSIFTYNPTTGAPMEVCYKLSTDVTFICAITPTAANPAQGNVGYAVYGLKQGTYNARIRHTGIISVTQGLYIDKVAILGTPATTLTVGTYENNNAAIVYSPSSLWGVPANVNYSGGNASASANKGATAQIRFVGTTLIVYQYVSAANSRNVLLCRVLQGPVSNPSPQCGSFSQYSPAAAYKVPIAFYGFGSGTNDVVIENRYHGGSLNIDKIMVN